MAATIRKPIKAVIFDMDGLLIDSERLYTKITNEMLAPYGKSMTWEIKSAVMGRPGLVASQIVIDRTGIPLTAQELCDAMVKRQAELFPFVDPLPGAIKLVRHLAAHNIPIAIATGSNSTNFGIKVSNLPQLFEPFEGRVICGNDPRLHRGKPHPDVFLIAASTYFGLSVEPDPKTGEYEPPAPAPLGGTGISTDEILVFEDGVPGVKAGLAAKMPVIWVPDDDLVKVLGGEGGTATLGATETIRSLEDFDPVRWGLPAYSD